MATVVQDPGATGLPIFGARSLWEAAELYHKPGSDEQKGKFSVSGFPDKLVNIIHYSVPARLSKRFDWGKSVTEIERFLLSHGLAYLEAYTAASLHFAESMTLATDTDDAAELANLSTKRFLYRIDDMRFGGGRVDGVGGFSLYALQRDVSNVKTIQVRLGGMKKQGIEVGTLATMAIVCALATDTTYQVIPVKLQRMCNNMVEDFRDRIFKWNLSLA